MNINLVSEGSSRSWIIKNNENSGDDYYTVHDSHCTRQFCFPHQDVVRCLSDSRKSQSKTFMCLFISNVLLYLCPDVKSDLWWTWSYRLYPISCKTDIALSGDLRE